VCQVPDFCQAPEGSTTASHRASGGREPPTTPLILLRHEMPAFRCGHVISEQDSPPFTHPLRPLKGGGRWEFGENRCRRLVPSSPLDSESRPIWPSDSCPHSRPHTVPTFTRVLGIISGTPRDYPRDSKPPRLHGSRGLDLARYDIGLRDSGLDSSSSRNPAPNLDPVLTDPLPPPTIDNVKGRTATPPPGQHQQTTPGAGNGQIVTPDRVEKVRPPQEAQPP